MRALLRTTMLNPPKVTPKGAPVWLRTNRAHLMRCQFSNSGASAFLKVAPSSDNALRRRMSPGHKNFTTAMTSLHNSTTAELSSSTSLHKVDAPPSLRTPLVHSGWESVVTTWLALSASCVGGMILIGGWTRLTESGLSMTDWKLLGGKLPRTTSEWDAVFTKYKGTPEHLALNSNMTLDEFKRIYFREWLHRWGGRVSGVIYGSGLLILGIGVRVLSTKMLLRCTGLFVLGGAQGLVGWWMVKSGLEAPTTMLDTPRVSPYRLAAHLSAALLLLGGCVWTALDVSRPPQWTQNIREEMLKNHKSFKKQITRLAWGGRSGCVLGLLTLISGAFVAGNDAGTAYTTWPKMNGEWIPHTVTQTYKDIASSSSSSHDVSPLRRLFEDLGVVQFNHRCLAYITSALAVGVWGGTMMTKGITGKGRMMAAHLPIIVVGQACLGIATLLNAVPLEVGVAHQAGGVAVLLVWLFFTHRINTVLRVVKTVG